MFMHNPFEATEMKAYNLLLLFDVNTGLLHYLRNILYTIYVIYLSSYYYLWTP